MSDQQRALAETPEAHAYSKGFTAGRDQMETEMRDGIERSLRFRAELAQSESDKHRAAAELLKTLAIEVSIGKLP